MTTPIEDLTALVIASADQMTARFARIGEGGTAGPAVHPPELIDTPHPLAPRWTDGWWTGARRLPANPGRVGGPVRPFGTVVHTTDMLPEEWKALLDSWTGRPGEGACAHFLVGRDEQHGVVQFVPIVRNGNHAGGPGHGVYRGPVEASAPSGPTIDLHPNLVTVGIEVHCAGGVVKIGGAWRLVEDGAAHGAPLPDADVIPDPQRPGRGWHVVTDYQRRVLGELLVDLEAVLVPVPFGVHKVAFGEVPPSYAALPGARVATHAELDPVHRADPWPQLSGWLRAR